MDGTHLLQLLMMRGATQLEQGGRSITLSEWGQLDDEHAGEVVGGRLVEEELPTYLHEIIVMWLGTALSTWAKENGAIVGGSGAKFAVLSDRGRKPDLSVYLEGQARPRLDATVIDLPPSICVEVVSRSPSDVRRDRIEKVEDYARFGVRYHWLVDPQIRSFEVLELGIDGRYAHALGASEGVLSEIPGCVGLVIDLDALWASVDEASDEA